MAELTAWTPERERRAIVAHVARCRFCRALLVHSRRCRDRALLEAAEWLALEHADNDAERAAFAQSSARPATTQQVGRSSMRIDLPRSDHDA